MSSGLVLLLIGAAIGTWFAGHALWRMYVVSSMRRVAADARPTVERLDRTIAAFYRRFPVPNTERLPLAPEDYPAARPRKPSPPRPKTRRTRGNYRRRP